MEVIYTLPHVKCLSFFSVRSSRLSPKWKDAQFFSLENVSFYPLIKKESKSLGTNVSFVPLTIEVGMVWGGCLGQSFSGSCVFLDQDNFRQARNKMRLSLFRSHLLFRAESKKVAVPLNAMRPLARRKSQAMCYFMALFSAYEQESLSQPIMVQ